MVVEERESVMKKGDASNRGGGKEGSKFQGCLLPCKLFAEIQII